MTAYPVKDICTLHVEDIYPYLCFPKLWTHALCKEMIIASKLVKQKKGRGKSKRKVKEKKKRKEKRREEKRRKEKRKTSELYHRYISVVSCLERRMVDPDMSE